MARSKAVESRNLTLHMQNHIELATGRRLPNHVLLFPCLGTLPLVPLLSRSVDRSIAQADLFVASFVSPDSVEIFGKAIFCQLQPPPLGEIEGKAIQDAARQRGGKIIRILYGLLRDSLFQ